MRIMPFEVVARVGRRVIFFLVAVGIPNRKGSFYPGEGIAQRNVTYRKHVALQCGCSVPAAE